jgi:hypothetical protein
MMCPGLGWGLGIQFDFNQKYGEVLNTFEML